MSPRRLTLLITCAAATAVCIVLALMKWTDGERVAATISTVCAVVSAGVTAASLFPRHAFGRGETARRWRVSRTGRARGGHGSKVGTGVRATEALLPHKLEVSRTGSATVGDDGEARTGIEVVGSATAERSAASPDATREAADGRATLEVGRSGRIDSGDNSTNITGAINSLAITMPTDVPRPHHTKYLVRVRQLRPEVLRERDAELAELAEFCTRPVGPAYVWWQAGPWAGKTALMAHFVDHPPDNVRIVSFFIIARDAAEADCEAFLENVIPQLAEIAEEPVPTSIAGNRRRDFFWELIEKADAACTRRGERLVLLVDGLDEDQGVTGSETTRSIASILPKQAGGSFRVVVAGRQNPPIPADVQADHPLRDPAAIRLLEPSPHGLAIKEQAELQLRAHLDDEGLQHEVLAFVTVARGGLTIADLAELTGETVPRIRGVLHSHSGRAYQLRNQAWSPGKEVMLAHDKLREAAEESIARGEAAEKLAALGDWAGAHQARGWPLDSPEYLLVGFYQTLLRTGSVTNLVHHVADLNRLEALRSVTGGDAAGLGQLGATIDQAVSTDTDLEFVVRLALVRDHLSHRNGYLPPEVLEVWVRLGDPHRAETLAESTVDSSNRARMLGHLVRPLVECGYSEHIGRVIEKACAAEILAEKQADGWRYRRDALAERLATWGFYDEAANVLRKIFTPNLPASRKADIVDHDLMALVAPKSHAGETASNLLESRATAAERAQFVKDMVLARARRRDPRPSINLVAASVAESSSIPESRGRSRAFLDLAAAAVCAGDFGAALELLDGSIMAARKVPDAWEQIYLLADAASLARDLNAPETTLSIALEARTVADSNPGSATAGWRRILLEHLARNLAESGHFDEAVATAERIEVPRERQKVLANIAERLFRAGQIEAADAMLRRLSPSETDLSWARLGAAQHLGSVGRFQAAEAALATVIDPLHRTRGLAVLASYAVSQGDSRQALTLVLDAEQFARSFVPPEDSSDALSALGVAHHRISGTTPQVHEAFNAALREAQRAVRTGDSMAWDALGRVFASMADAVGAEDAEAAANEALTFWDLESRLISGQAPIGGAYEFAKCVATITPALRDRIAAILTTATPKIHGTDAHLIAAVAAFLKEELGHEANGMLLINDAMARLEGLPNGTQERANEAIFVVRALFKLGRAKQAHELLDDVLEIAQHETDSDRLSLLTSAMNWVGPFGDMQAIQAIVDRAHDSDLRNLSRDWAHSLGALGRTDQACLARNRFEQDDRRNFDEGLVLGLVEGGHYSEALAKYYALDTTEVQTQLAAAAIQAHLAQADVAGAVQLVTTTPTMTKDLRRMLPNLYELCNDHQARKVFTLALASGSVEPLSLAKKFPETLIANANIIEAIHPIHVQRSP